jgi:predicted transglutaminase-like cysteine proteinase
MMQEKNKTVQVQKFKRINQLINRRNFIEDIVDKSINDYWATPMLKHTNLIRRTGYSFI